MDVELKLRFSFGRGELNEADERFFALLRAVDDYGSLRQASEATGLSYRAAWGLLREWTESLGAAPVDMHRGRGAALSELGRKLLWARQYAQDRLTPELDLLAAEVSRVLESTPLTTGPVSMNIFASHSMAQEILRELAISTAGVRLDIHNRGSLDSLRALKAGECRMAGFHLVEGPLRRRLALHCRPWLDNEAHRLIRVASRRQGLMLHREITGAVGGVTELVNRNLCFVNRQPGSGTRMLFDALLQDAEIDPSRIRGYDHEEFTHSAVAALLSSGVADAGFGVEAAADRFGLPFVPLATETYYFALHRHTLEHDPAAQLMVSVIASSAFRRRVGELTGYDPRHSGRRESVADLLT
jgi:putative molybdopterin biosynthesis protein